MKMEYFDKMEELNLKRFNEFNKEVGWFSDIEPSKRGTSHDCRCTDINGRTITVELKIRKGSIDKFIEYGDVLIEPSKYAHFTAVMESGYTLNENCLYINFFDDGVMIWDFSKINNLKVYPNHRQVNYGKGQYEFETRFGLSVADAIVFQNVDGRLKQRL